MSDQAPDIIGPVVAYRAWRVTEGRLRSMAIPFTGKELWRAGADVHARCFNWGLTFGGPSHAAPAPACKCGIYVMHTVDDLLTEKSQVARLPRDTPYPVVVGEVEVWGRSERYERGRRVEWCRVRAFYGSPLTGDVDVAALAETYGVPVLDDPDGKIAAWREKKPEQGAWLHLNLTYRPRLMMGMPGANSHHNHVHVQAAVGAMAISAQDFKAAMEKMAQSMRETAGAMQDVARKGAVPTTVMCDELTSDPDKPIPSRRKDHLSFTADHRSPRSIRKKGVRNGRPR